MGAGRRRGGLVRAPLRGGLQEEEKSIDDMAMIVGERWCIPCAAAARVYTGGCAWGRGRRLVSSDQVRRLIASGLQAGVEARRRRAGTTGRGVRALVRWRRRGCARCGHRG